MGGEVNITEESDVSERIRVFSSVFEEILSFVDFGLYRENSRPGGTIVATLDQGSWELDSRGQSFNSSEELDFWYGNLVAGSEIILNPAIKNIVTVVIIE